MNFLYPGFLYALLAIAIPVIIHLFNFKKFKKVSFSNVAFLERLEIERNSKDRLKERLLLLFRILTLIFLVLAFAQPYTGSSAAASDMQHPRVAIYIDNSFSMELQNGAGPLLEQAKLRAKNLIEDFGPNVQLRLMTNDFDAAHEQWLNKTAFIQALSQIKVSAATPSLKQVLKRQDLQLRKQPTPWRFFLSDFQSYLLGSDTLQLPTDRAYHFIKFSPNKIQNIGLDSLTLLSATHRADMPELLLYKVHNYGTAARQQVNVSLEINGAQKALKQIALQAGEQRWDTLGFSGLQKGWQEGRLMIQDQALNFDDSLYFSFPVKAGLKLLQINDERPNPYVSAAFNADPYFQLHWNKADQIDYNQLASYQSIILEDLKNPSSGLIDQLKNYVAQGGSLMLFPAMWQPLAAWNDLLRALSLPQVESLSTVPQKVQRMELENPFFRNMFEELPKNIDLPQAQQLFKFNRQNRQMQEPLLSLAAGELFFSKFNRGKGQVYLSAVALQKEAGNLVLHPVFLPLLYQAALNAGASSVIYYQLGDTGLQAYEKLPPQQEQSLYLEGNGMQWIPERRGDATLFVADQLKSPGFYKLMQGQRNYGVYAFNYPRAESDLSYLTEAQLRAKIPSKQLQVWEAAQDAIKIAEQGEKIDTSLWKVCLILALICLLAEILCINLLNKQNRAQHESFN